MPTIIDGNGLQTVAPTKHDALQEALRQEGTTAILDALAHLEGYAHGIGQQGAKAAVSRRLGHKRHDQVVNAASGGASGWRVLQWARSNGLVVHVMPDGMTVDEPLGAPSTVLDTAMALCVARDALREASARVRGLEEMLGHPS